ncbi:MAG: hypothetical protein M3R35_08190 [Candidatus Eremiobacteraeota bacterium]|nr:hypothetical protein [Candidatus Eremiobacteraeota bacterium]
MERPARIQYGTRTGALLRVDGIAVGAFDREHRDVNLPASASPRRLQFEVEVRSLPTNGLPSGAGLRWALLNARAHPRPSLHADVLDGNEPLPEIAGGDVRAIGHSHLDVAWLWTYEETRRKAARTFAIAAELLERDPTFKFVQSQPQLYAFVERDDAQLFARVTGLVESGRFDPDVAALWVESDCNLPSGESLLRQLLFGHRYCLDRFGIEPGIAWLPDSFGFANTLPMLLAHAGVRRFATTKLQWNDTTRFPYPQFVWRSPDGSEVLGALLAYYDGGLDAARIRTACERAEPILAGYGDGGGGVTNDMLADLRRSGAWIRPRDWFERLEERRAMLPVHCDELYLEYHRGVYTTHHDLKAANALLERALSEAEELAAWCTSVRAPHELLTDLRERLDTAWEIVLRNQFHDVLPGTSIAPVVADALAEYARAGELAASVIGAAQQSLPRTRAQSSAPKPVAPVDDNGAFRFDNGLLTARVLASGTLVELTPAGGENLCAQANVLALYGDKPKAWEAWNIDSGYERSMRAAKPIDARIEDGVLIVRIALNKSSAAMRIAMHEGEPFLRVDAEVDWRERRTLLRVENWLLADTASVTYGTPHGTIERSARRDTPQERAKFEVPGQRFACVRRPNGSGLAIFSLDTYGWSARTLPNGGVRLGHSLLRGTCWPDKRADYGAQRLSYAYAPFTGVGIGALERAWLRFAHDPRVRLFTCEDDAVAVVACKPAQDGDGVIVRVRECDGSARQVALRCNARMREAQPVDALERPLSGEARVDAEHVHFSLPPYGLRSFRVRA